MNLAQMELARSKVTFWDLGGGASARSLWARYYAETHGVVFVVDAADADRLREARDAFRGALDHPDLISRLVLIDSSGLPRTDEQFLSEEVKMREWSVARLGYLVNSEPRVASALDPHFDGGADPERVKEVFLGLENRGNWNAMIDLVRDENGARAGELAGLQPPTLLLWGELDQAYPPATFGATFAERIPAARLVVVPGAGHYPHEQTPARVAQAILAFHRGGLTAPGLALPGR